MSETVNEEKVDKAIGLLKDAGFKDLIIVGKGYGKQLKTTDFEDKSNWEDVAQMQGYLAQLQTELTAISYADENENESGSKEKSGEENE